MEGLFALAMPIGLSRGQEKEARGEYTLRNADLEFCFVTSQGKITSRCLRNKLANEIVNLPEADFVLEFDGGRVANPAEFTAKVVQKSPESVELLYSGVTEAVADLQVRFPSARRRKALPEG
jgi:hypothetical protein